MDRDLKRAGIPKVDDRGRTVDVHALRHTFGTQLGKAGVPLQTARVALRHSAFELTAGVYTGPRLLDVAGAVEALPSLPLNGPPAEQAATGPTGRPCTATSYGQPRLQGQSRRRNVIS